ncbi:MAG: hypothetical protein AAFQ27_09385 [Pseudomonadota bacterium]
MIVRTVCLATILCLATGISAENPPDIVADAARAIVAQDAEALASMRFRARGFDSEPVSIERFLARVEGCEKIAEHVRGTVSFAHQIHYECPNKPAPPARCATEIIVVAVDRASSPDVTAFLRHQRLETPDCRLPPVPVP